MVWINNFFFLLVLNAITGNIAFGISLVLIPLAVRCGCIKHIYNMLKGVEFFFIVPVAYGIVILKVGNEVTGKITGYDGNTVMTICFQVAFVVWLIGAIVTARNIFGKRNKVRALHQYDLPMDDPRIIELFYETYPEIAKRKIPVYRNLIVDTPMIVGVLHPTLLVPDRSFSESMLKIILQHEATHIIHKDNLYKFIGRIVICIIWWNPLLYRYFKEWTKWAETYCDISVCDRFLDGDRRIYSGVILKYSTGIDISDSLTQHSPFAKENPIMGRIKRLTKIKRGKKYAALGLVLSAIFVAGSSMTALAAGNVAANAGKSFYWETVDKNSATPESEETLIDLDNVDNETVFQFKPGELDLSDYTIVDMDNSSSTDLLETIKDFNWDVAPKTFAASGNFLKTKDSTIQVSCYVTAPSKVYVGVIEPNGTFTCTYGKGQMGMKYTVKRFGYHKVAVQNTLSSQINAHGYYVR